MLLQSSQCQGDQFKAITHVTGPAMVMAGPGTGKTTTLANRITRLILDNGYAPNRILALTFNKDAQVELQSRITAMLASENYHGDQAPAVMTYHKFGYQVASQVLQLTNYGNDGSVMVDPTWLVKAILGDTGTLAPLVKGGQRRNGMNWVMPDGESRPDPKRWLRELEVPQETMIAPSQIARHFDDRYSHDVEKWLRFYVLFRSELNRMGKVTFADMLYVAWLAMANKPDELQYRLANIASVSGANSAYAVKPTCKVTCASILTDIQNRYDILCVDEAQDTNPLQGWVATQIARQHGNIMVVGDHNQAIYQFRGATPEYIGTMMSQYFSGYTTYNLDHTRRCATSIVEAANKVIAYNDQPNQYQPLQSSRSEVGSVSVNIYDTTTEQAAAFADEIALQIADQGATLDQFAILCRTKKDIMSHEPILFSKGLHYRVAGGGSVYSRKEIRIAMGYMLATLNMATVDELLPCINVASSNNPKHTHFLGMEAEKAIVRWVALHDGLSPVDAIRLFVGSPVPQSFDCPYSMQRGLATWLDVVDHLIGIVQYEADTDDELENIPSGLFIDAVRGLVVDPYLKREREESDEEGDSPLLIIAGLSDLARDHRSPVAFAAIVRQLQEDGQGSDTQTPAITLSTAHRAKGLEWSTVFISSCHNGQWPHKHAIGGDKADIGTPLAAEERNLYFVAITRAKNALRIGAIGVPGIFIAESGLALVPDAEVVPSSEAVNALSDMPAVIPSDPQIQEPITPSVPRRKRTTKPAIRLSENIRRKRKGA